MLEILEYFDPTGNNIVYRIPPSGSADIKFGAQLIVQENQEAIFFRDGKALDVFKAGRHTLSTMNLPVITKILSIPFGSKSPFRAAVFFVNKHVFTDMKWGTKQPVYFRDNELSVIRLRAFGNFTVRVVDSFLFINTMATQDKFTSSAVESYLKDVIVSRLNTVLGENLKSIFDLSSMYDNLGTALKLRLKDDFLKYGIELVDLFIQAITPPEEVQKTIDERSSMSAIKDMNQYMQYKTANAMTEMAKNPSEGASAMSMGFGAGMGMMFPQMMNQAAQQADSSKQASAEGENAHVFCTECGTKNPADARFCLNCGNKLSAEDQCPSCKAKKIPGSKFCFNCGARFE